MKTTASQQETIRSHPQRTRLYLSVFQPRVVFQAQVNGSVGKGSRVIPFDNVTLGAVADVEVGFTLLVGSTAGARDIGKIRIKAKAASQFEVSENSNVIWANDQFITVLRYVDLWPIYPRIIQNPADAEDVIFYKDYDLVYSNQNSILGTFVNAGPHRGVFKGENVYYSSTGTFNPLGSALTYDWAFEGASVTGSTSAHPGSVVYNTTGDYVARLTVTAANGAVDTVYRYISVYDRPGEGSDPPVQKWEISNLGGSRDEGGYRASIRLHENVTINENSVIVIFGEDWYGATQQSFGGNYPNAEKIFFVGYVLEGTIRQDWQHSYTEFQVGSLTEVMKTSLGFSISVESKAAPTKWFELLDMDGRRGIYHYLRWHTTAMQIADFQFVGNDQKIQFFDSDRTSMYDAIDSFMRNTLVGRVSSDRQGKVWIEQDAAAYPNPTGSFTSVMEITRRDWAGEPSIDERQSDNLSYLEMGGIAYSGSTTGTFSAHLAEAPGISPAFRGRLEVKKGFSIASQSQLNQMAGNVWANENTPFPRIGMDLAVNARNLDIAPQETVQMNILASDTVRGQAVSGLYIPNGMTWNYDTRNQILLPNIDFTNLVNGAAGDSIGIPLSVPDAGFETGWGVPGLQIPPLPLLTWPPFLENAVTTIVNNMGLGGIGDNPYASVGWLENVSAVLTHGGITVNTQTRSAGVASIILSNAPDGYYFILGQFTMYMLSGGTPGATGNAQLLAGTNASTDVRVDESAVVDSGGGARINGSAGKVVRVAAGQQITLSLGSGGISWGIPYHVLLTAFKVSTV